MKNKTKNIIETIFWSFIAFTIFNWVIKYFIALREFNDEGMFIYGFNIMVSACTILMVGFITYIISKIWENKKSNKDKKSKKK